jgi:regulatory protein
MDYKEALQYAMRLCAAREMCKSDIIKKVCLKGLDVVTAEKIILELEKGRFIDEYRYTRAFVNDKVKFSRWGVQRIKQTLQQKGISKAVIIEVCQGVEGDLLFQNGLKLAQAKLKSIRNDKPLSQQRKIYNLLLYRGYDVNMIWRIIRELKIKSEEETD